MLQTPHEERELSINPTPEEINALATILEDSIHKEILGGADGDEIRGYLLDGINSVYELGRLKELDWARRLIKFCELDIDKKGNVISINRAAPEAFVKLRMKLREERTQSGIWQRLMGELMN